MLLPDSGPVAMVPIVFRAPKVSTILPLPASIRLAGLVKLAVPEVAVQPEQALLTSSSILLLLLLRLALTRILLPAVRVSDPPVIFTLPPTVISWFA